VDKSYSKDFKYSHNNPYHDKLALFSDFIMRDDEAEVHRGKWNTEVFKREAPLVLEIGSGYGHFMMDYCQKNPDVNYVGLDYRFKRSFNLAKKLAAHPTKNFRYLRAKGERVQFLFEENEVDHIYYFFPDPWPKTRHNKKRLFQEAFLESAFKILKPTGKITIKTDHDGYADWMEEHMEKFEKFNIDFRTRDLYQEHPEHHLTSFQTKFEKIFLDKKINIKSYILSSTKTKA
jgi:tRNA (guanine-N7-)-methyltransferase